MNDLEPLHQIFHGRLFRIPDYQRGYAWDDPQWSDLLEDLELLGRNKSHFTGTLILTRSASVGRRTDNEGNSYETFDVIDGQQRLTTLVMLLDAIRDEMDLIPELRSYGEGIRKRYLTVYDRTGSSLPRLRLGKDNHDFFFASVLGFGTSINGAEMKSQQRLQRAHERFEQYLMNQRERQGQAYSSWLEGLFEKITSRLEMLVYVVDSDDEAGAIFEAMNNRGKPITELDKVKNHLLYLAAKLDLPEDHDLVERINATWTQIFRQLMAADLTEGADEDRLLRIHWLMAYNYQLDQWDQIRSIKGHFNLRQYEGRHTTLLADLKTYVESLGFAAQAFSEIYKPNRTGVFGSFERQQTLHRQIIEMSEKLRRLGQVAPFLSLLIALRIRRADDAQVYLRAATLCELFAFRIYAWLGRRASVGQSRLVKLGADVYAGRLTPEGALDALQRAALEFCSDAQFAAAFDTPGHWYNWYSLKYFLYEYEQYLGDQQRIEDRLSWTYVETRKKHETIEHILPQSPTDPYWTERFTPEQLQMWTHDIGNLCLTRFNTELSNKSFQDKVGILGAPDGSGYINSVILMEKALVAYPEWNEAAIIERRNKLRDWAFERWSVPQTPAAMDDYERDLMVRVLTRLPIPAALHQILKALYNSGEAGMTGAELTELLSCRRDQLAGVVGGLGRRINQTAARQDGRVIGSELVLRWEQLNGEWIYRLRPEFREVLESNEVSHLGIVELTD